MGGIKKNIVRKTCVGAMPPTPPLFKVIESKSGNKTLVLNNFKFFIVSVNKYQLIFYIVTIYIIKVSYTII
jgi:hypothetical protein